MLRLKPLKSCFGGGLLSGGQSNQLSMFARNLACFCAMPLLELRVLRPGLPLEGSLGISNLVVLGEGQLPCSHSQLQLFVMVSGQASFVPLHRLLTGSGAGFVAAPVDRRSSVQALLEGRTFRNEVPVLLVRQGRDARHQCVLQMLLEK